MGAILPDLTQETRTERSPDSDVNRSSFLLQNAFKGGVSVYHPLFLHAHVHPYPPARDLNPGQHVGWPSRLRCSGPRPLNGSELPFPVGRARRRSSRFTCALPTCVFRGATGDVRRPKNLPYLRLTPFRDTRDAPRTTSLSPRAPESLFTARVSCAGTQFFDGADDHRFLPSCRE